MSNLSLIVLIFAFFFSSAFTFDGLVVPNSSAQTQNLYQYLKSTYGKYVLSGQTTFSYDDVVVKVGKMPLIRGFDMQNYSPHNPWYNWQPYDDGTVNKCINWYKNQTKGKGIVTFFWHWFSPSGGALRTSTFYTNNTDFNIKNAVTQGTQQNKDTLRDIDAIAVQLKKLQNQRIPIIWRPLHQAGGRWFWWGSKTNVETLKLFHIIFDRLVSYHKINNLIWTWSTPQNDWYPGNQFIDIVGYDSYPGQFNYTCQDTIFFNLQKMVNSRKMVAMTENGPIPTWKQCLKAGITWGFFMSWSDLIYSQNTPEHILDTYNNDPSVITVDNKAQIEDLNQEFTTNQ